MLTARNPMSDQLRFRYVSVINIILVQNPGCWNNRFTVMTFNISSASVNNVCNNTKKYAKVQLKRTYEISILH